MDSKNVYQFKITLKEIAPPIWRCIQVSEDYTFWDLHVAIQDSMGWTDSHLHSFTLKNLKTGLRTELGIPNPDYDDDDGTLEGWKEKISAWFSKENDSADYVYDFGDYWEHSLILEKILPKENGKTYPCCTTGARACPPEDCGSIPGYFNLLEIIKNPEHKEHKEMLTWLGGHYDPEQFDKDKIHFDNPGERLKALF